MKLALDQPASLRSGSTGQLLPAQSTPRSRSGKSSPVRLRRGDAHWQLRLTPLVAVAALPSCGLRAATTTDAINPSPAAVDKSAYNLFNPTPAERMRELTTDRPDKTESPYTVDAGHFQIEMDFAVLTLDRADGVRSRTWNVAPINVKAGLFNNVDLQVIFGSYLQQRMEESAPRTTKTTSGAGDLTTRLKVNLWGNDGGSTAFGLIPFLTAPTNTNGLGNRAVAGGVIFPFAIALPGGWDMGLETEADFLRGDADAGYHVEFVNSVTCGHGIVGRLEGYLEFFSSVSTERGSRWVGTVDGGLVYHLAKNVQLDAGCNVGTTRSADDLEPFAGLSVRF
jgi:hypothetical protein